MGTIFKQTAPELSNMYIAPFVVDGVNYRSVEHYYQSQKPINPTDQQTIRETPSPYEARAAVRLLKLKPDFLDNRMHYMFLGLCHKFSSNPTIKAVLTRYQPASIVEYNDHHDNFFGHCTCARCEPKPKGNVLGKMLTAVRRIYDEERNRPRIVVDRYPEDVLILGQRTLTTPFDANLFIARRRYVVATHGQTDALDEYRFNLDRYSVPESYTNPTMEGAHV